jgi:hypothetical protein
VNTRAKATIAGVVTVFGGNDKTVDIREKKKK